jgi:hypothetical protein
LVSLPVADGVVRDQELLGRARLVPAQKAADLKDLEAGGRRIVGPMTVGNLAEARLKNADNAPGDGGQKLGAVEPGLLVFVSSVSSTERAKVCPGGDAQQPRRAKDDSIGEAPSNGMSEPAHAKVNGKGRIGVTTKRTFGGA